MKKHENEWVDVLESSLIGGRFSVLLRAIRTTCVYLAGVKKGEGDKERAWLLSCELEVQAGTTVSLQGDSPDLPERLVLVALGSPYPAEQVLGWVLAGEKGEGSDPTKNEPLSVVSAPR